MSLVDTIRAAARGGPGGKRRLAAEDDLDDEKEPEAAEDDTEEEEDHPDAAEDDTEEEEDPDAAEDDTEDDEEEDPDEGRSARKARKAERARIKGILSSPSAERNPRLAAHLAFETGTPVKAAVATLNASASNGGSLGRKMTERGNPALGTGASGGGRSGSADDKLVAFSEKVAAARRKGKTRAA